MSDPLDAITQIAPSVDADHELVSRVRSNLMATITEPHRSDQSRQPRPSGRRRALVPIAAVIVLATAAAGWAIFNDSSSSTSVMCPGNVVMDAVTGDPVADCTNEWERHNDTPAPAMTAYDNGKGGVSVIIDGDPVPDVYVALDTGIYQDPALIELEAALDDSGEGLSADCYDDAAGHQIARRELDRLGLTSWSINSETPADGAATCAYYYLNPAEQALVLIATEAEQVTGDDDPYVRFATQLTDQLAADCLNLAEAADLTRTIAANTDVVVDGNRIEFTEEAGVLVIHTITDATASCTRSDVNVAGAVDVTLRGPQS